MNNYLEILYYVHTNHPKLQSDYVRYNAKKIAELASRGHITSVVAGVAHNCWFTTAKGCAFLEEYYN